MRTDDGGGYGSRTRSLLRAKQTLYPVGANPPCIFKLFYYYNTKIFTMQNLKMTLLYFIYAVLFLYQDYILSYKEENVNVLLIETH